jgi:hypothetical protein
MELDTTFMKWPVVFRVKRHDGVVVKESDSVVRDERCIVVLLGLQNKVLRSRGLKFSKVEIWFLETDDVRCVRGGKILEWGCERNMPSDIPGDDSDRGGSIRSTRWWRTRKCSIERRKRESVRCVRGTGGDRHDGEREMHNSVLCDVVRQRGRA